MVSAAVDERKMSSISPWPAHHADFAALAAAAEEPVGAVGLEPGHADTGRHVEFFQDLAGAGIDPPQFAFVIFPGGVPERAVDPGDPGDEAIGNDGAQNRAGLGIDLVDLPVPMLPDPQRSLGPGQP